MLFLSLSDPSWPFSRNVENIPVKKSFGDLSWGCKKLTCISKHIPLDYLSLHRGKTFSQGLKSRKIKHYFPIIKLIYNIYYIT